MRVALVNTNRVRPPIAPIGLEYVAEATAAAGHDVSVLDLCWEDRPEEAVGAFFRDRDFGLVGVTVRNTDDCSFATRDSFLPGHGDVVASIRKQTGAPIVAGGVGFSVMPEHALEAIGADAGIRGDGEYAFSAIAGRIARNDAWDDLPNLVFRREGRWRRNRVFAGPLSRLPPMRRERVDNRRYFAEGGQAGVETKRGCSMTCIYCADPVAKGTSVRLRPPREVADEIECLLSQGIDHVHTCDSEFNVPESHASEVCGEIGRRRLGDRLRLYAYCTPGPFSPGLAKAMRRAGCRGINFGTDSGDERMLKRLGRRFGPREILSAARLCRENGMAVMFDLLLGSPGETPASIAATIEIMRKADPDVVGVTVGVRIYPGTDFERHILREGLQRGQVGGNDLSRPVFFLEPAVAPDIFARLERLIGDDPRFLFFDPNRPDRNYNYNANRLLEDAILQGYRGAYWDILRRLRLER